MTKGEELDKLFGEMGLIYFNLINMTEVQMEVIVNKKKRRKEQRESKNNNQLRVSSSTPRTRSQVSPEWTTKEALILVNEIAAVEKDCLKALSTYQKWKIIVDNCVVLDVARNLNQCRTKWNSLVNEYNLIKNWDKESESRSDFYWSLESERRREFGLPENFNDELFRAIDDYMWCHKEHPDTDPDPDPDPDTDSEKPDLLHAITNPGTKKQRWRSKSLKTPMEEKTHKCCREDTSQTIHAEEKPQERCVEENSQIYCTVEKPERVHAEEEHQESQVQESTQIYYAGGKLQTIHAEEDPQESCAEEEPHTIHAEEEPEESLAEEHPQPCCSKEKPRTIHLEEETKERYLEENHQTCCPNEKPQSILAETQLQESHVEEKPQKCCRKENSQNDGDEKPKIHRGRKKKMPSTEEMKQMMVEKLHENAEMIQAVVNGNFPEMADLEAADSKNIEGFKTDLIRSQGDKLIACLQNIVNSISQFPCLLQECD